MSSCGGPFGGPVRRLSRHWPCMIWRSRDIAGRRRCCSDKISGILFLPGDGGAVVDLLDDLEALLHQYPIRDGVLDCDLDFYPPGVRLGPHKARVDNPCLAQAPQPLQAQSE